MEMKIFYSEKYYYGEDLEFTYKALFESKKVRFIQESLSFYVQREGSLTYRYNIQKFHSVLALMDLVQFITEKNDPNYQVIADKLRYEVILDNYFFNLKSCIRALCSQGYPAQKATRRTLDDLEKQFPEIKALIDELMTTWPKEAGKMKPQIRLYSFSPYLYYRLSKIVNSFRDKSRTV